MNQTLFFTAKQFLLKTLCSSALIFFLFPAYLKAQTTVATTATFSNDSTVSTVTFNFQNTNGYPIVLTNIEGILSDFGPIVTELWYKTTAINGAPGMINATNGWTLTSAGNVNGVADTTNISATQPLFGTINLTIPANTTYGIAIAAYSGTSGKLRVGNSGPSVSVSAGGCNFLSGTNIGYSSNDITPAAPTATLKGWVGKITFISGAACSGTPNTPVISGPSAICAGSLFNITSTGYSVGSTYSYQWQQYNTTTLGWDDIPLATTPVYNSTGITASSQFRLKTTCSGNSSYSNSITVNISTGFAGGTYSINKNAASSATNFTSFATLTAAMSCGITGPVTINVTPGSGPYTEEAVFAHITGTSAINRIRINGHNETLQYATTGTTSDVGVLIIDNTNYLTVDSLTIKTLAQSIGIGVLLTDTASYDSVTHCFVDMRSITSEITNYNTSGISLNGDYYNSTGYYSSSNNAYIGYNHVLGRDGEGGPYYGIYGGNNYYYNYTQTDSNNVIDHNTVENFAFCGISSSGSNGSVISNNDIHRTNKVPGNNFYGIQAWGGNYSQSDTTSNKMKIIGNRIHDPSCSGGIAFGIETGDDWYGGYNQNNTEILVANNVIYNFNATTSSQVYGIYYWSDGGYYNDSVNTSVVKIYHNTIDLSQAIGTGSGSIYGLIAYDYNYGGLYQDSTKLDVKNNLIAVGGTSTSSIYGFYYNPYYSTNYDENITAQRNNIYLTPGGSNQFYGGYNTTPYATMANFQAAYPALEVGSLTVDPQYLSASTGDFSPTNPLLFANGVNLQADVPVDILGRTRSATPTPGAFEVGSDMGVSALLSPLGTYCSSVKMVSVAIKNYGQTNTNSVQINWSLNGAMQTPVSYTGTILPGNTANVNLGNGLFMPSTPVTIKAWTSNPNGQMDSYPLNDTLTITTQSSTSVPVNIGPDDSICTGTTITLDAGFPGSEYVWDNATYNQQRTIQNAGTYYVKVTAFDGCIGVDTMKLTLRPLPVVDLGPQRAICEGSTTTLDAGHPGATYLWDNGSTNETRTVDTAGLYEAQVTDQFGCKGVGDVTVIMKDMPSVEGLNATHADSGVYTFYPLNPLYVISYKWDFGDGTPQETGYMVQHAYLHNGIYTVTLYLTGECTGLVIQNSKTVDVFNAPADNGGGTGINNTAIGGAINVYPNPAKDLLQIDNKSEAKLSRVVVYNALGQMMLDQKADNVQHHQLSTSGFANGLYSLRIETDKGIYVQKFEVMR